MGDLDRSGVGLLGSLCMNNREVSAVCERAPNRVSLNLKAIKRVVRRTCWRMELPTHATAPQSAVGEELAGNASPRLGTASELRHCRSEGDEPPDHKYRVVTVGICAMNKKVSG